MRPGVVTTLLVIAACVVPEYGHAAKPRHLAPGVPCTMANRMDMFVDEDDIMWECVCESLKTGHICRWQVIGGVDSVATRKRVPKHRRLRIVAYTIPAVTA